MTEDRARNAFDDLARRTEHVDPHASLQRLARGEAAPASRRWVWALAGAAIVVAVVGGVALFDLLPGTPDDDRDFTGTTTTVTVPADSTTTVTSVDPTTTTIVTGDTATWFRVNRDLVEVDTADPFLNVRADPDPSSPIVAKLPPTYAGIRWTGDREQSADGGTWYRVDMVDPVALVDPSPLAPSATPSGYVNAAYLEATPEGLPVTSAELTPCAGDGEFAGRERVAAHIGSLRAAELSSTCTRIVIGFSTGEASFSWDGIPDGTSPAGSLPEWYEAQSPWPLIITLPDTTSVWPGATDIDGAYVVRNPDRSLSLVVMRPAGETIVRAVPDRGLLVVDLVAGDRTVPPAGALVALTSGLFSSEGAVDAIGIARPFEANLGVTVLDETGTPVEAMFSGSPFFGTIRSDTYAVPTNDWMEAWGRFAVRIDGLDAGDYTLVLNPDGGSDQPRTLDIPFTVESAGGPPEVPSAEANDIAGRLVAFAEGAPEPPALAGSVVLRLGNEISVTRTQAALEDRSNWVIEAEEFQGFSGPFDILRIIADRPQVRVSEGQIPHCAAPPIDFWPGTDLVRPQINLEPVGIDSCIQWYAVTLRVDDSGQIEEIVLDLFGP
jgi:hypothetical protein